ncbi:MAG TPA: hypothetical protein VHV08_03930, partial [Pirellulales bacterium]|nr:hypothetical protein [Pirellulales bacterium]
RTEFSIATVAAVWRLHGTRTESVLTSSPDRRLLADSPLPCSLVRWSIAHEWARSLADLVERRLMLLYHQRLTRPCLAELAQALVEAGILLPSAAESAVNAEVDRLQARYGKHVEN